MQGKENKGTRRREEKKKRRDGKDESETKWREEM